MTKTETAAPAVESKSDAPVQQPPAPQDAKPEQKQQASAPETPSASPKPATTADKIVLTAPEGADVVPEVLNVFAESAAAAGLSPDAAQSVLNGVLPRLAAMHADQVSRAQQEWADKVKADPTIGGGNLPQTLAIAGKVVETWGDKELSELLDKSGFRHHPAVLRFLRKAGASLREDTPVKGGAATVETDIAKRLFPDFK